MNFELRIEAHSGANGKPVFSAGGSRFLIVPAHVGGWSLGHGA